MFVTNLCHISVYMCIQSTSRPNVASVSPGLDRNDNSLLVNSNSICCTIVNKKTTWVTEHSHNGLRLSFRIIFSLSGLEWHPGLNFTAQSKLLINGKNGKQRLPITFGFWQAVLIVGQGHLSRLSYHFLYIYQTICVNECVCLCVCVTVRKCVGIQIPHGSSKPALRMLLAGNKNSLIFKMSFL